MFGKFVWGIVEKKEQICGRNRGLDQFRRKEY
jgi:hypothetical protein